MSVTYQFLPLTSREPTVLGTHPYFNNFKNEVHFVLKEDKICELRQIQTNKKYSKDLVFTQSQKYLINVEKAIFLDQIVYNVPKIFYYLKPEVGLDLSIKFAIKQLSGIEDPAHISHIQKANKGLTDHFLSFFKISCALYTTGNPDLVGIPDDLRNSILCSLIEIFNINRYEQYKCPALSFQQLEALGLYTRFEDEEYSEEFKATRGELAETNHITIHYMCFECQFTFNTTKELRAHISDSHDNFVCLSCGLQFTKYLDRCSHALSFCRAPINKNCIYCAAEKSNCKCAKRNLENFKMVLEYLETNKNNDIFDTDFFSLFFQYYDRKIMLRMSSKQVVISPISQAITSMEKGEAWPIIDIRGGKVNVHNYQLSVDLMEVKKVFLDYTDNFLSCYRAVNDFILLPRNNCTIDTCKSVPGIQHNYKMHVLCPFANQVNNEVIKIYDPESLLKHYGQHFEDHFKKADVIKCLHCKLPYEINEDIIYTMAAHYMDQHSPQVVSSHTPCQINTSPICPKLSLHGMKEVISHLVAFHHEEINVIEKICHTVGFELIAKKQVKIAAPQPAPVTEAQSTLASLISTADNTIPITTPTRFTESKDFMFTGGAPTFMATGAGMGPNFNFGNLDLDDEEEDKVELTKISHSRNEAVGSGSGPSMTKTKTPSGQGRYLCHNESHRPAMSFETADQLELHIYKNHKCIVNSCHFSDQYDSVLLKHYKDKHLNSQQKCDLCGSFCSDLQQHIDTAHYRCPSCLEVIETLHKLQQHMRVCDEVKIVESSSNHDIPKTSLGQVESLEIDNSKTDFLFSETLIKLLEQSNLSKDEIEKGKEVVKRQASENLIAKHKVRNDLLTPFRSYDILFDIPKFATESNLSSIAKAGQIIGQIKENDIFDASVKNANKQCVENYERLERVLRRLDRAVVLCGLSENQTKVFLQSFCSQRVQDCVTSYLRKEFSEISFKQIILTLQNVYCPIDLPRVERVVQSYSLEKDEDIFSFSSRAHRHLTLCSKRLDPSERENYIESNLSRLIKQNLPISCRKEITQKEGVFSSFNSQELLDAFLGWSQGQQEETSNNDYQVFFNSQATSVPEGKLRTKPPKAKNTQDNRPPRVTKPKFQRGPKTPKKSVKTISEDSKNKLKLLGAKFEGHCFRCLSKDHIAPRCPYFEGTMPEKLHFKMQNGKEVPCGFHAPNLCYKKDTKINVGKQPSIWANKSRRPN